MLSLLLGVGLAFFCIRLLEMQMRPVVLTLAEEQVKNVVTQIVNDAVNDLLSEQALAYEDLICLQKDGSGQITAITTSALATNRLRTALLNEIAVRTGELEDEAIQIPVGNLTGLFILSGRGPSIPIRVLVASAPEAQFQNQFSDAGVNQTRHQMMLEVTVPVKLVLAKGGVEAAVHTQVCLAETVIVGRVPETYLELGR